MPATPVQKSRDTKLSAVCNCSRLADQETKLDRAIGQLRRCDSPWPFSSRSLNILLRTTPLPLRNTCTSHPRRGSPPQTESLRYPHSSCSLLQWVLLTEKRRLTTLATKQLVGSTIEKLRILPLYARLCEQEKQPTAATIAPCAPFATTGFFGPISRGNYLRYHPSTAYSFSVLHIAEVAPGWRPRWRCQMAMVP